MDSKTKRENTTETAIRSLHYFCTAYSFCSSNIQLNRALSTIIRGTYTDMNYSDRVYLFDYFLALEELLPALYELQEHLNKPETQEGNEGIYKDEVSSKDMYASFKRHPEWLLPVPTLVGIVGIAAMTLSSSPRRSGNY